MKQKIIYLLRHCQPERSSSEKLFLGQTDLPLSDLGMTQARQLGRMLQCKTINAVFSSNLKRGADTAEAIAYRHGLTVNHDRALREIDLGKWESRSFKEIAESYPLEFERRGREIESFKPPEGESFLEVRERVMLAFNSLCSLPYKSIVIVGHAGVNRVILCELLGMPLSNLLKIGQDYGCMNIILPSPNGFKVSGINLPIVKQTI